MLYMVAAHTPRCSGCAGEIDKRPTDGVLFGNKRSDGTWNTFPLPDGNVVASCLNCGASFVTQEEWDRLNGRVGTSSRVERRAPISKRLRFEIFKRDGFRCVYCGATPVSSPLHVDHVEPVAAGGESGPENLVTACASCNLGKSSVPLHDRKFKADMVSEADLDHAQQIREYLEVQREVARARGAVVAELLGYWAERCGGERYLPRDLEGRLRILVKEFEPAKLMEAIDIVAAKSLGTTSSLKYFHGILRRWRNEQGGI